MSQQQEQQQQQQFGRRSGIAFKLNGGMEMAASATNELGTPMDELGRRHNEVSVHGAMFIINMNTTVFTYLLKECFICQNYSDIFVNLIIIVQGDFHITAYVPILES